MVSVILGSAAALLAVVGLLVVAWKLPSTRRAKIAAVIAVPIVLVAAYQAKRWYSVQGMRATLPSIGEWETPAESGSLP